MLIVQRLTFSEDRFPVKYVKGGSIKLKYTQVHGHHFRLQTRYVDITSGYKLSFKKNKITLRFLPGYMQFIRYQGCWEVLDNKCQRRYLEIVLKVRTR